ncbi:MAG: hypothetical protein PVG30_02155 [Gammaproteobacteria bacterium]|jgi:hypothetical protein
MNKNEKLKIYEKFKERKEEDVIKNAGETYNFGNTTVTIKELPWLKADEFENVVLKYIKQLSNILKMEINEEDSLFSILKKINIGELLEKVMKDILRDGLVELATIATQGEVTMDTIISSNATKREVGNIVTKAISLNYEYLKNLIPLATQSL